VELATLASDWFVAVFQNEFVGDPTDHDIWFRVIDPQTGEALTDAMHTDGGFDLADETDPDVAALTFTGDPFGGVDRRFSQFVIVWTDGGSTGTDIRAAIVNGFGDIIADNILVNTTQEGLQNEANVVGLLDGGFLVTWDDDEAGLVRAQRFDALGTRSAMSSRCSTNQAIRTLLD
jgi:hypothetical protein